MSSEPTIGEYVIGVEGPALLVFSNGASGRAARVAEIGHLRDQLDDETRLRLRNLEGPALTATAVATAAADIRARRQPGCLRRACPQYRYGTSNSSPDGGNARDD